MKKPWGNPSRLLSSGSFGGHLLGSQRKWAHGRTIFGPAHMLCASAKPTFHSNKASPLAVPQMKLQGAQMLCRKASFSRNKVFVTRTECQVSYFPNFSKCTLAFFPVFASSPSTQTLPPALSLLHNPQGQIDPSCIPGAMLLPTFSRHWTLTHDFHLTLQPTPSLAVSLAMGPSLAYMDSLIDLHG